MIWPFRRKSKKRMARIVIDEPITSSTRVSVLKALKQIEDREFPALILRIDSPGGCLLYTSPSPRDATLSRMPSSA